MSGANLMQMHGLLGSSGPCSCVGWDVTDLPLSGLWQADYSGSPFVGIASSGTSAGRDMTTYPGSAPWDVGTAQNGYDPAYVNGLSLAEASPDPMMMMIADGDMPDYMDDYIISGWVVAKTPEVAESRHLIWSQCLFNFPFEVSRTATAAQFHLKDVDGFVGDCSRDGITIDEYCLYTFRYDGAHVQVGVNEYPGRAPLSSVAYTKAIDFTAPSNVRFGVRATINAAVWLGDILEIGFGPTSRCLTDDEYCKIRCRARDKYDLALVEPAI